MTIVERQLNVSVGEALIPLAVAEAGAGGRPLVLAHGFTGAKEDFVDHLPALAAAGWHAVAPDLRGHGSSHAPAEESAYDFASLAGDLFALADALGWPHFAMLGHSMGGMVAQVAALGSPERIDALVLVDTTFGPVGVDRELADLSVEVVRSGGMGLLGEVIASLPDGSPLDTTASRRVPTRPSPLGGDDPEASWAAFGQAKILATSPAMYAAMVPIMLDQPDRRSSLAELAVPTLVMVGEHDTLFLKDCRRLAATIPGARLEVVPDAGHNPQHETPDAWLHALLAFLAEVAS